MGGLSMLEAFMLGERNTITVSVEKDFHGSAEGPLGIGALLLIVITIVAMIAELRRRR
jgi:hypothetical protein